MVKILFLTILNVIKYFKHNLLKLHINKCNVIQCNSWYLDFFIYLQFISNIVVFVIFISFGDPARLALFIIA